MLRMGVGVERAGDFKAREVACCSDLCPICEMTMMFTHLSSCPCHSSYS